MTSVPADATRLVRYGLQPAIVPAKHDEYRELVARCLADPAFREQTEQAAEALELSVAAVDATVGIVVVPAPRSVFAPSWGWLREHAKIRAGAEDRMIAGVALAAIAAVCFPTAASLSDPAIQRFTPTDVDKLLRRHGELIADGEAALEDELDEAWQTYLQRKSIDTGDGGKRTRHCTVAIIERLCELLADQRLLLRKDEEGQRTYRSTDRFRHLVAHHGATLAYRALTDSGATDPTGAAQTPTATPSKA
jgi:hypothetical protein